MKDRLLSNEFENYIQRIIFNFNIPDKPSEFNFIEDFELLCLNQFLVFKSIFDILTNFEKDEIIKFWHRNKQLKIDEYFEFTPESRINFDPYRFDCDSIDELIQINSELLNYNKLFAIEHYKKKFRLLIIQYLENELSYLQLLNINPNTLKKDFYPLEYLDLSTEVEFGTESNLRNTFLGFKKKHLGNLFWFFEECSLKERNGVPVNEFCTRLCQEYGVKMSDTIRQNYKKPEVHLIKEFKFKVVNLLPEEQKKRILLKINSMY
jgi:hypothetical protein